MVSLLLHGAALPPALRGHEGAGFASAGSCQVSANAFVSWQSCVAVFPVPLDFVRLCVGPASVV